MTVSHVCAADLGLRSDGTGAVVLRVEQGSRANEADRFLRAPLEYRPPRARITLVGWLERRPRTGEPLSPSVVCADIARLALRFGCQRVWTDYFYVETVREELRKFGVSVAMGPSGQQGKAEVWSVARSEIVEGRVKIPRLPALITQLQQVRSKPTSGGSLTIEQPRRPGSHGDLAAAFALAVWAATHKRPEIRRLNGKIPGL